MLGQYVEIAVDAAIAYAAYYFFGWIGFAIWTSIVVTRFLAQLVRDQRAIAKVLLERLPDRCGFCHREIVDEGGVFDEDGIYHSTCADKLESLEELREEAGVRSSEAIHKPQPR